MSRYLQIALWGLAGLVVVLLVGFFWGRSGRAALEAQARSADARTRIAETRLDLSRARAALLGARVDLFEVNFGDASRQIEAAKPALESARQQLVAAGDENAAKQVAGVLAQISQAQDAVNRLDQSANTQLAGALGLLDQVQVKEPPAGSTSSTDEP